MSRPTYSGRCIWQNVYSWIFSGRHKDFLTDWYMYSDIVKKQFEDIKAVNRKTENTMTKRKKDRKYNDQKKKGQTDLKRCKLARTNVDIKI